MRMTSLVRCACALNLVFCGATTTYGQLSPEKAEKTFTVSEGLDFSLWASEPLFVNPTTLAVDHKGRVWVCEAVNYRRRLRGQPPLRPEGDRILVLEDTNGDGKADKVTTFFQSPDVESPLGIAILPLPGGVGQRVFVCQSPQIWVFDDLDGDLKADGPPKILLKGFPGIDHDHGVHGIQIGPDGRLWFTVGDTGVRDLKSTDGKGKSWTSNATDCRAGTVWSCKLDGTDLIRYAHNFRNNYMATVDSFRSVFLSDNDDDGNQQTRICFVMPDGDYGYHPRGPGQTHWHEEQPGIVPKILRTGFGSPTGITTYEGDLLPGKYQGTLFHTDAGPRQVRCYHLKPKGAGYEVEAENVVTSTDPWFRPSDVQVGPDGSVYVADWYDPGVGGHGMGDTTRGRIYRLAPKGSKAKPTTFDLSDDKGIIAALGSPNFAARAGAIEALRSKGKAAARLLLETAQDQKNPYLQARALGLLVEIRSGLDEPDLLNLDAQLDNALKSRDDRLAQLAVRIDPRLSTLLDKKDTDWKTLVKSNPSPVLRELLLLWRNADAEKLKPFFNEVVAGYQADDTFLRKALNISAGNEPSRREKVMADLETVMGGWSDRVAQLVFELRPAGIRATLAKRIADASIPAAQRADLVDLLAAEDDPATGKTLVKLLGSDQPDEVSQRAMAKLTLFLDGKWSQLTRDPEFAELLGRIPDKAKWARLAGSARLKSALEGLDQLASSSESPETRKAAIEALGRFDAPEALAALGRQLENAQTRESTLAALGNITQTRGSKIAPKALELLKKALEDGREPGQVIAILAQSNQGSEWLLTQKERLNPELAAQAGRYLRNSPFQVVRNKAMIAFPAPGKLNMASLPKATELAKRTGRVEEGRKIFEASAKNELQCLKCHRQQGRGGDIGPDLSLIGKKASRENLLDSLLTPSKAIADQYIVNAVSTNKGQTISGLLVEESPGHVIIRDGNGKDYKIPMAEIDERTKSKVSIMPADLVAWMSEDDLVDLVEYLLTLKTGSITPSKWKILGPMADEGGNALAQETLYEKGQSDPSLKSRDGKTPQWRPIRPGADGYLDLAAFHGQQKDNSWSYLTTEIKSETAQDGVLLLGADDGSRVWINGKLVHEQNGKSAASPAMFRIPVKLKAGSNSILVKITNGDGPHGAYLTILSEGQLTD